MRIAIVRGDRGSGKTSACLRLLDEARTRGYSAGGVICPGVFDAHGVKAGCHALDAGSGASLTLGSRARNLGGPAWKAWSFSAEGFAFANRAVRDSLARADRITFLDEIGPLELERSEGFLPSLLALERSRADNRLTQSVAVVVARSELCGALADRLEPVYILNPDELGLQILFSVA